jgi:hypothetical protein
MNDNNDLLTFEIDDIWKYIPDELQLSPEAKEMIIKYLQDELDRLKIMILEINPDQKTKIISNEIRDLLAYLGYKICY